jgi:hypothetical protein
MVDKPPKLEVVTDEQLDEDEAEDAQSPISTGRQWNSRSPECSPTASRW